MRLLVLTQSFAPVFEGGTERVARAQARALAAAGHAVRVVGAVAPERAGTFEVDGLPVHLIAEEPPAGALDALVAQRLWLERPARRDAVLALAAEHGPFDAVHVQHFASLSLGLVPHFAGVGARVVVSLHDLFATCARFFRDPPDPAVTCPVPGAELDPCARCIAPEAGPLAPDALLAAVEERARRMRAELDAAHALVAPSAVHARRLEALLGYPEGRVHVVPNGLVGELPARPAPSPARAPLRVLHFGHRARTKGALELCRAADAAARRTGARIELVLMGAELEAGFDAELRAACGAAQLELRGAYTPDELAAEAARAHVAAFPSKALESYGLVVDEALALGLPVLVSGDRVPGEAAAGNSDGCGNAGLRGALQGALVERLECSTLSALPASEGHPGRALPRPLDDAALAAWADALAALARELEPGPDGRAKAPSLRAWRAAIPPRMPGPADAAAALLPLLCPDSA